MLEVRDLEVAYGAARALWGVSLDVKPGELLCVVGPNGAGKTTLINTIAGLLRARGGRMAFDGRDITQLPPHRFCEAGIALVPEGRRLFTGMSVRENLEMGSYLPRSRAKRRETLEQVIDLFPGDSRETCEPGRASCPGGQQQMVAIARALMARPRLLLLDERFAGLVAPHRARHVRCHPRRINADGMSVLLVEQNVAMAMEVSQRAYVLEEGRIVAEGAPQELLARPEIPRAYLGV